MKKELHPDHPQVTCDVCGRTLLKGEHAETYLAPAGERKLVCDLCAAQAADAGWIRESAHAADLPASRRRPEPRRTLLGRLRRGSEPQAPAEPEEAVPTEPPGPQEGDGALPEPPEEALREQVPGRRTDARHVRAVPTNADVKIERALELFNESEHTRTIAGIARALGEPWVSASPVTTAPSEVAVVVAWELSWYRFRVDLGDAEDPVALVGKGEELAELAEEIPGWNGRADADGRLEVGVGSSQ